ncbi:hypothetical protein BDW59DRAFT_166461 [Aspergillus cavernicola]|uniref:Trichothecene 3-O-acetyltransferase-like N-terminal domain-containing protein n=1 Tax=Aspergillus cavernicola TaxID=176166 RepID=A0ABR4HNF5_9EURO
MHLGKSYTLIALALAAGTVSARASEDAEVTTAGESTAIEAPIATAPSKGVTTAGDSTTVEAPIATAPSEGVTTAGESTTVVVPVLPSAIPPKEPSSHASVVTAQSSAPASSTPVIPSSAPAASSTPRPLITPTPSASKTVPSSSAHKSSAHPKPSSTSLTSSHTDNEIGTATPAPTDLINSGTNLLIPSLVSLAGVAMGLIVMAIPLDILAQSPRLNKLYTQVTLFFPLHPSSESESESESKQERQIANRLETATKLLFNHFPWTSGTVINDHGTFKIKVPNPTSESEPLDLDARKPRRLIIKHDKNHPSHSNISPKNLSPLSNPSLI